MKTISIILAVTLAVLAVAIFLLFRTNVDAGSVIGYGSVLALIGMAALEYRINWKRLLGR